MNGITLFTQIEHHLKTVYADLYTNADIQLFSNELAVLMRLDSSQPVSPLAVDKWTQNDIAVITYGNTLLKEAEKPLATLHNFLFEKLKDDISIVHILPFFPYCSDDGFAVMDFYQVNPPLGDWSDIQAIANDFKIMGDLVINHASSSGEWFQNFIRGEGDGHDYFFTTTPNHQLNKVVRPRTSPLLRETDTAKGTQHVWCTFSHEQVDFDFRNIAVLKMFVQLIRFYLDHGIRLFRLDAVAFLWKEIGTNCLNLVQTHEIVRLLRLLTEQAEPEAIIITETNIPNRENLSYFGNANEAHWIYNFSLPPLLLNTLITGDNRYLRQWLMSMPPAQMGTAYFNFIASHDGIGLRPAEGLLSDSELATLINTMQSFGGHVSWRAADNGIKKPYEINIALFDALKGTVEGEDDWQTPRFLCAHGIMLALEGVPGFYIHSLLATQNDEARVEAQGHNRAINRHQWTMASLNKVLDDTDNHHQMVFNELQQLIKLRKRQPAFHPNATQYTLQLGTALFGFWRQSIDHKQSIFCVFNITKTAQSLCVADLNLIATDRWYDLITGAILASLDQTLILEPYQMIWLSNQ